MKDLKLPAIKEHAPCPDRILSMDERLQFVQFNLEIFLIKNFICNGRKPLLLMCRLG